jgi:hypothetical protein
VRIKTPSRSKSMVAAVPEFRFVNYKPAIATQKDSNHFISGSLILFHFD